MTARGLAWLQVVVAGCGAVVAGCGAPTEPGPGRDTTSGTPAGGPATGAGTPTEPEVGATCTVRADNALIADCTAWLPDAGPAGAFLEDPDGALRLLDAVQDGRRLDVVAWRLHESTPYTVRIQPATGAEIQAPFTTGSLPTDVAVAAVVTGTPSFDYVLVPHECGSGPLLLLLDAQGRVVWYLFVAAEGMTGVTFAAVDGFQHTPDDTVLAVLGRTRVREWTWTQEQRLDLAWPGALPGPVHHDVVRWNGHTYVLTAESVTGADGIDYVMDGVLVFDPAQDLVARWSLADRFSPSGGFAAGGGFWGAYFPGAWDWAHSNGIFVDPDGDLLLSSRQFHTVLKLAFDWTAPDFGEVQWAFSADPASPLGSDLTLQGAIAPLNFSDQHHPNLDATGRLLLFDNRGQFVEESRATRWDLDPAGGTATLRAAWSVGEHCSVQGSAFPLPNDHVVAACAQSQRVFEFSPLQADPVATLDVPCASGGSGALMVRAIPVSFAD